MFRKMPFILVAVILFALFFGSYIPEEGQSILYGISLSIKSFIVFVLPIIVFGLLFKTAVQLASRASKMILIILGAVCLSNFISTLVSYSIGNLAYGLDLSIAFPTESLSLLPKYEIVFPKWIDNSYAMFSGLLLGLYLGWAKPALAEKASTKIYGIIGKILKVILFGIPFLVAGFVIKMDHDQVMGYILKNYSYIFAIVTTAVYSYIILMYFVLNRFHQSKALENLKNMLPAAIAGFGSMSSAAAMPLTLIGVEKNAEDKDLAKSIVPATVNIHLIGDCFAIPIFAFAVLKSFGVEEPGILNYLIFAAYFVMAKFSVAAVPGGGILVMLPILEGYLGFNAEMLSLITALYILFDPVITCANVLGNGALTLIIEKLSRTKDPLIEKI